MIPAIGPLPVYSKVQAFGTRTTWRHDAARHGHPQFDASVGNTVARPALFRDFCILEPLAIGAVRPTD